MKYLLAGVATAALFIASHVAHAADFSTVPLPEGLLMTGMIDVNDGAKLRAILKVRDSKNLPTILYLNSPGGNVRGALDMANVIAREGMAVVVGADNWCLSAASCSLLPPLSASYRKRRRSASIRRETIPTRPTARSLSRQRKR
jgi:ATP-dependent protease ClpP protease subunit